MGTKKQSHPIDETEIPEVGLVKAGRVLEHPMFGLGEIKEIAQWESGEITVGIEFKNHGLKWLVPEFAKLSEPKQSPKKPGIISKLFGK
jgi:hypothetical protein